MTKPLKQAARLTPEQVAEVECAREEARAGRFATEEEMNDAWRRFGISKKSVRGQTNSSGD
jgi:predicted transcriptional regulator